MHSTRQVPTVSFAADTHRPAMETPHLFLLMWRRHPGGRPLLRGQPQDRLQLLDVVDDLLKEAGRVGALRMRHQLPEPVQPAGPDTALLETRRPGMRTFMTYFVASALASVPPDGIGGCPKTQRSGWQG